MNEPGFVLAPSVARSTFEEDVYAHLGALAAVEFSRAGSDAQSGAFRLNAVKYQSLEQAAFEEASRMEAKQPELVDWRQIDQDVSAFELELTESLRTAPGVGDSRMFVQFSARCYENWLTYRQMYPHELHGNPWARTTRMMRFGRLLVIDDEDRLIGPHRRGVNRDSPRENGTANVVALVKGAAPKPKALPIDNRFDQQAKFLAFLRTNARGHANSIRLGEIASQSRELFGEPMRENTIQLKLGVALKRAGVVGSHSKGYFFIESEVDLIHTYCFHRTKHLSTGRIMRQYQVRARDMNIDLNLEYECAGSSGVLNRRIGSPESED
jgi:hypothetical protein